MRTFQLQVVLTCNLQNKTSNTAMCTFQLQGVLITHTVIKTTAMCTFQLQVVLTRDLHSNKTSNTAMRTFQLQDDLIHNYYRAEYRLLSHGMDILRSDHTLSDFVEYNYYNKTNNTGNDGPVIVLQNTYL